MKIPVLKQNKIVILCILIILGVISCFLTCGIFFPCINQTSENSSSDETSLVQHQKVIDTNFEIYELNENYPRWMTIVHLTYNELKEFPDLERVMHGVNTDPNVWQNNQRVVAWFDGNYSEYIGFHNAACKNKTLIECYPSSPLYEYNGQYYKIFYEKFRSHSLPGCEGGNYNCTPL
jgi:competence protein ComGC